MLRMACGNTMRSAWRRARQAQGGGGLELALVHRQDAAADDLRREGGLVQREAQHGGGKRADQLVVEALKNVMSVYGMPSHTVSYR
jgi:hypothetical protein